MLPSRLEFFWEHLPNVQIDSRRPDVLAIGLPITLVHIRS